MNERDLFRAIGEVDDSLIEAAEKLPQKRRSRLAGTLAAACLCVAALGLAVWYLPGMLGAKSTELSNSAAGETLVQGARAHVEAAPDAALTDEARGMPYDTMAAAPVDGTPQTAPAEEPVQSYGERPADFSFVLSWDGCVYDSATGLLTGDGEPRSVPLTEDQVQRAWKLLSGLELPEESGGEWTLTVTADGQSATTSLSREEDGPVPSVVRELFRLLDVTP